MSRKQKQQIVKIANPNPFGSTHVTLSRARRLVRDGVARFDAAGRLQRLYDADVVRRKLLQSSLRQGPLSILEVREFCGADARPDRAVLPPSPEVLARQLSNHTPLRPPLRVSA